MNRQFIDTLMFELNFPALAKTELMHSLDRIEEKNLKDSFDGCVNFFYENHFDFKLTEPLLDELSVESDLHRYTVDMLFLLACSENLRKLYQLDGTPDSIFIETMRDLYAKLMECYEVHGIWGTFVTFWYPIFFSKDIFKLGRLEYENTTFSYDIKYEKNGICIQKGDSIKSIHIPSHFGPLTKEICLTSYQQAYEFFKDELKGSPLICICDSWLLHHSTKDILPPTSNILSFAQDFDIILQNDHDTFNDMWRVFGADSHKPLAELPEKTSMQKNYKKYLLDGKKTGSGVGILIFDGNKFLHR